MANDVTVVVEDKLILVDGKAIKFENGFNLASGHEHLWALQYHNGRGEIEFADDYDLNQQFDSTSYDEEVKPYVDQFEAEMNRLNEIMRIQEKNEEDEYNRKYNVEQREREKRDTLIAETDYLLLPDYPISDKKLKEVVEYRQALRDVTEQEGWPRNIVWPEKPEV